MAHREDISYLVDVKLEGFEKLALHLRTSLSAIASISKVMREHGRIMQARAVHNVSGDPVTDSKTGQTFIIHRVTGKLARSIQVTEPTVLSVAVVASAEYASDVELGTRGPVDLKLSKLAGKIIPMPVSKVAGKAMLNKGKPALNFFGPSFGATMKTQFHKAGYRVNPKFATTGKFMGNEYIVFRRVPGPGGKGWVIPQRPGRPFMAEAGEYTKPLLAKAVEETYATFLSGHEL